MAELHLEPKKTALVLIDLQNGIVGMGPAPHPAEQVLKHGSQLAAAFRAHGSPVVYVHVDLNDFQQVQADVPMTLKTPIPPIASEIAEAAGFQAEDILVTKRHWGAFAGTDLEEQLKSRGIDTVVIGGISTNIGVESTVRQGTGLGFNFVFVEDASSAQDAEQHRYAVEKILPRLTRVHSTVEVLAALA
jgi:nicotinamidase-related amidase